MISTVFEVGTKLDLTRAGGRAIVSETHRRKILLYPTQHTRFSPHFFKRGKLLQVVTFGRNSGNVRTGQIKKRGKKMLQVVTELKCNFTV